MTHNVWIPADEIKMEVLKWNKKKKEEIKKNGWELRKKTKKLKERKKSIG